MFKINQFIKVNFWRLIDQIFKISTTPKINLCISDDMNY